MISRKDLMSHDTGGLSLYTIMQIELGGQGIVKKRRLSIRYKCVGMMGLFNYLNG